MTRPNLLFIYTDEQAFNTLAVYGNSQIQMPNLNRLANESVIFDEAYVTQPVCTPSRSSLLTGLYPHTNGCTQNNIALPANIPCLPEMIDEEMYATGHYGKWHLGDEVFAQHGFHDWVSIEDNYNEYFSEERDRSATSSYHDFLITKGLVPQDGERFGRGEAARLPEELGKPAFLAARASEFIRTHQDRPFALYVNFLEPHMPFFGPRDDQYSTDDIPLPASFTDELTGHHSTKLRLLREHFLRCGHGEFRLRAEADWRRLIANYWGLCSLIDTHVGTILDTLEDCGLRDNTIVVFTSDHGDMMGAHRLLAKTVMFQEAIRVPLLMRLPGQCRQKRVTGPVSQIDIVPTLLQLLSQSLPDHLQGHSLCSMLEADSPEISGDVFIQWNGPDGALSEMVRTGQVPAWMHQIADPEHIRAALTDPVRTVVTASGWKFNCSPLGEHELFDLRADPHEIRNHFEYNRTLARELGNRIRRWQSRMGDTVELPVL